MRQSLPPPDSNPQSPMLEPRIQQQVENSTIGSGMQAAQGDNNTQIQGDNNWFVNALNIFLSQQAVAPESHPARPRNQRLLIDKVTREVAARLRSSLHNDVLINLQKEQQPQQVKRPWDAEIKIGLKPSSPLPKNTNITEVFDQEEIGGKLLILGVPGSGKTTTQLELAQNLISRAENEPSYPIPVLFNLSSWKNGRPPISKWLVNELRSKYGVRASTGKEWVENRQLLPLLDGLDELNPDLQELCVQAINQLLQRECSPQHLVVCSRGEEYGNYKNRLQLNGAIYIQPLTNTQINDYLVDNNHVEIWQVINKYPCLIELTRIPLWLSIVILSYQEIFFTSGENITEERWDNISAEGWTRVSFSSSFNSQSLLDAYIRRMLTRQIDNRVYVKQRFPSSRQTRLYLVYLAQQLQRESQTEFLIEEIQPSWLRNSADRRMYKLIFCLSYGLIGGLIFGLINSLIFGSVSVLTIVLVVGLLFALEGASNEEIRTVEVITWSWKKARSKFELIRSLFIGGFFGAIYYGQSSNLSIGLGVGLFSMLFYLLARGGLDWSSKIDIETKIIPNQGIWKSVVNGVILGLFGGLLGGLLGGLSTNVDGALSSALSSALSGALSSALSSGGKACIQHFVLRLILYCKGYAPWNYCRFLNYATERLFLQRVGGRYRFIHKLLQDHFAQMPLDTSR